MSLLRDKLREAAFSRETIRHALGHAWGVGIVAVVVALGGLLIHRSANHTAAESATAAPAFKVGAGLPTAVHKSAPVPNGGENPADPTQDFDSFAVEVERLEGRFSERDEFGRNMRGKSVRWKGYVRNVLTAPENSGVVVVIGDGRSPMQSYIWFGKDLQTRAFALREHDHIEIAGVFASDSVYSPTVRGKTFSVLPDSPH